MRKNVAEIVLYNAEGEILLQHRTEDAPTFPNMYCIFGGKIEEGETPDEAVMRECYEELEYTLLDPLKLLMHLTFESALGMRNKYIYSEKYDESKKLVLHEGQGMMWVNKESYKLYNIIDHDVPVLEKIFGDNMLS